jgi:hypothetical protein
MHVTKAPPSFAAFVDMAFEQILKAAQVLSTAYYPNWGQTYAREVPSRLA